MQARKAIRAHVITEWKQSQSANCGAHFLSFGGQESSGAALPCLIAETRLLEGKHWDRDYVAGQDRFSFELEVGGKSRVGTGAGSEAKAESEAKAKSEARAKSGAKARPEAGARAKTKASDKVSDPHEQLHQQLQEQ